MLPIQYQLMYKLENSHWWFLSKRKFISALLPTHNPHWNILDLGCGTGGLSAYLDRWGHVDRIEHSDIAAEYLKKRNLTFKQKDINTVQTPKNHYDLIVIIDVLYHKNILNDVLVLQHAYEMLNTNGILIVCDSAVPWLYSHHDEENMARERYSLGEISDKIQSAGFVIEKKSYIYFFLFPVFFITRLLGKFFKFESVGRLHPIPNTLCLWICNVETKLFRDINFPIGSSVFVRAVKK